MTPQTRRMVPSDRAAALAALGDPRAIDQPNQYVYTNGHGGFVTLDVGLLPMPHMGAIAGARNRRERYELALAACEGALDFGATHATFDVFKRTMLTDIERSFRVDPIVGGFLDGVPALWSITVDLLDAREQLLAWLERA